MRSALRYDEIGVYTRSEREDEKYIVGQAVASAERTLAQKGVKGVCMNAVRSRSLSDKITLLELNRIAKEIVDDSLYYGGNW